MGYYLERTDEKLAIQINNFANKIDTYATQFGFTPAETLNMRYDAMFFTWAVNNVAKIDTYKKNWTVFKTILLKGEDGVATNNVPAPPTLDVQPIAVTPGMLKRFTSMVARVKAHPSYTTAIGQNLGIEGAENATLDPQEAKPVINVGMNADKVVVEWTKGAYSGIHIEKDSGNGFVMLDKDFIPDYIDNSPLPASGTSALWKYRAIYLIKDEKVGQWSNIASITVAG